MIRKIALAALLFLLSGPAANAAQLCTLSATGVAFGESVSQDGFDRHRGDRHQLRGHVEVPTM